MNKRLCLTSLALLVAISFCGCQEGKIDRQTGMDAVEKPWPVWVVAFSLDGRWLAAGRGYRSEAKGWMGGKGEVNVWKIEDWQRQDGYSASFTTYVHALAFTPKGEQLVAAATKYIQSAPSRDNPLRKGERRIVGAPNPYDGNVVFIWKVPDGSLEQTHHFDDFRGFPNRGAGFVSSIDIHPNSELIGLSRAGSASVVLHRKTGNFAYEVGNNGLWQNLAFSPDGKALAVVLKSSVQLCDASTGKELARFEPKLENPAKARSGKLGYEVVGDRPICACYSGDGKQIAVGISNGSVLLLTADLTKQIRSLQVSRNKEWVMGIASAPRTDLLAAATPSGVGLFEVSSGKRLQEWGKTDLKAFAVALSPDGKLLAVGYGGKHDAKGERRGGYVNVWDTATGRLVKKLD